MREVHQGGPTQARHFLQPKNFSLGTQEHRFAQIRPLVENRSVLDLGCGTGHLRKDWMHGYIREVAKEAVGVEIDARTVEAIREKGFEIIHADAEALDLGRTFDVVFAGELIEHLSCFGALIECAKRHMHEDSRLVMTTPNAFAISNFVYRLVPGPVRMNRDHVCWFCEDTMRQLLGRHGLDATITYLHHASPGRVRSALARIVRAPLPERVAWNRLIAVATPRR